MREFKFRAWVADYIPSKEAASMVYSDKVGGVGFFFNNFDGEEIMQFTGLKDRNGIEIYEGDIVSEYKIDNFGKELSELHSQRCSSVVRYNNDSAEFIGAYSHRGGVVIGNIHQNPELLK